MAYKNRTKPDELIRLHFLRNRMTLSEKDRLHYVSLKKGYEGEVLFDSFTAKLECECIVLNDLLLNINNTTFQIDSLIITSKVIYLIEVKNYEGDYYYENDRFYKKPHTEITNPLNQLRRTESLLRQLLQNLGFTIPIEASVVFIHPEFTLYQTPLNIPFIFPTQVNRYLKKLNTTASNLNGNHKSLADKLISQHLKDSPFKALAPYNYEQLKKGIICAKCNTLSLFIAGKNVVCNKCGYEESVPHAVMRSVAEFILLFPERRITTKEIFDWCVIVDSKKRIQRILDKNFQIIERGRWSFYQ